MSKIPRSCMYCHEEFLAEVGKVNAGHAKFCSCECYHQSTRKREECFCFQCGKQFFIRPSELKKSAGRFCSNKCYVESFYETRVCKQCGKEFRRTRGELRKAPSVYCSVLCRNEAQKKPKLVRHCQHCGAEFSIYPYLEEDEGRGKYCSSSCKYKARGEIVRGENHPSWNNGSSFEPYGLEWTEDLRLRVRQRDNYTCAICGLNGIIVHHVDYDKTNNALSNLIVLCARCHGVTNFNRGYWENELSRIQKIHRVHVSN